MPWTIFLVRQTAFAAETALISEVLADKRKKKGGGSAGAVFIAVALGPSQSRSTRASTTGAGGVVIRILLGGFAASPWMQTALMLEMV